MPCEASPHDVVMRVAYDIGAAPSAPPGAAARIRLIEAPAGARVEVPIAANAGFDGLLLDGEHAPNDITILVPQLMAPRDSASAPVVRPSWNDTVETKRLLDNGFCNFLVPFVQSADVAQRDNRYCTVAG